MQIETLCPWCFSQKVENNCSQCDWTADAKSTSPLYLTPGTLLHEQYQIGRVLGHGGFGITYLAYDLNLQIKVALKEYLPKDFATRAQAQTSISVFDGSAGQSFAYGLDQFIDEARILAKFQQHPGIVSVLNFFREHGTGYIAMEYVAGITLKEHLTAVNKIAFPEALQIIMPVMDALREVHEEGLLHRDVSPDNIFITQDGMVKLLDFGAARFAMGERSRSLSVILKPGYAPEEQYRTRGQQGAWTDVYALCATFYRMITGQLPIEALDRIEEDELELPSKLGVAIPARAEEALLHGLAVRARHRYQSISELQSAWLSETGSVQPAKKVSESQKPAGAVSAQLHKTSEQENTKPKVWLWLGLLLFSMLLAGGVYSMQQNDSSHAEGINNKDVISEEKNTGSIEVGVPKDHYSVLGMSENDDPYSANVLGEKSFSTYALTISVLPKNARVRILNIKPSYEEGMLLETGKYHIEVSHEGYQQQRQWLEIIDEALDIEMILEEAVLTVAPVSIVQKHQAAVNAVAFSADGRYVVSAGADQQLILWNAKTGQALKQFQGHVGAVNTVSFSYKGHRFASAGADQSIRIWDARSGKQLQLLKGHSKEITDIVFAPDGKVVSVAKDQTLRLWDLEQGLTIRKFSGHAFSAVALSPHGRLAVSPAGLGSELRIWDLIDGGSLLRMKGHRSKVTSLSFSSDATFIASASKDKTIRLWRSLDSKEQSLGELLSNVGKSGSSNGHSLLVLQGHTEAVNDVIFSPDAKTLASASDDQTVRIWDVASGKLLRTFSEHKGAVTSVAFSADGKQLVSGGMDHQLIFRRLP